MLDMPRPGAVPAQLPVSGRQVWDTCRADAAADPREEAPPLRHRRLPWWPGSRHGRRINTVMQTCFFAISGVLPQRRAIAAIKAAVKKTYGARAGASWSRTSRPSTMLAEPAPGDPAGRRRPSGAGPPPRRFRARRRPSSAKRSPQPMIAGRGDLLPVSAFPPDGTWPMAPPLGEAQPGRTDPGLGRGAVHPVRQVRVRLPARRHPRQGLPGIWSGARDLQAHQVQVGKDFPVRPAHQLSGGAGGLHRLHPVRGGLPDPRQGNDPPARRWTWSPSRPLREQERPTGNSSSLPDYDRRPQDVDVPEGHPCSAAPVRILRRLRRLRRNPLPQAGHPAVRRPHAHRQRHRLLLHLRRQPADHALLHQRRGPRSGLEQLPVRGQCRIRPRHAPGHRLDRQRCCPACSKKLACAEIGDDLVQAILVPSSRTRPASRAAPAREAARRNGSPHDPAKRPQPAASRTCW
jgi:hypothetical protein